MGAFEGVTDPSNPNGNPCAQNDAANETGPGALTYTTAPFSQDTVLGGPVDATVYATSTTPDTELVATLSAGGVSVGAPSNWNWYGRPSP